MIPVVTTNAVDDAASDGGLVVSGVTELAIEDRMTVDVVEDAETAALAVVDGWFSDCSSVVGSGDVIPLAAVLVAFDVVETIDSRDGSVLPVETKSKVLVDGIGGGGTDATEVVIAGVDVFPTASDVSSYAADGVGFVGDVVGDVDAFVEDHVTKSDVVCT